MKWKISFRLDAADDDTGIKVKDLIVEPVESEINAIYEIPSDE